MLMFSKDKLSKDSVKELKLVKLGEQHEEVEEVSDLKWKIRKEKRPLDKTIFGGNKEKAGTTEELEKAKNLDFNNKTIPKKGKKVQNEGQRLHKEGQQEVSKEEKVGNLEGNIREEKKPPDKTVLNTNNEV